MSSEGNPAACRLDAAGCTTCGNGLAEGTEACDGDDLRGESCVSRGFGAGTLSCAACAAFDESGCAWPPAI